MINATLMATGGQCAQTAMQIDQRLRHELLFRDVHSKVLSPLVSAIFGLLDFPSRAVLYCVRLERLRRLWTRCISIKRCSRDAEPVGNILHRQLAGVHECLDGLDIFGLKFPGPPPIPAAGASATHSAINRACFRDH
jgi:hypothetical protein